MNKEQLKAFMKESNKIEGENRLNPNDLEVIEFITEQGFTMQGAILFVHELLGRYLKRNWVGKYRTCQVYVGSYTPPAPLTVPYLMDKYFSEFDDMNSWTAHNEFEKIHPFQDLNGRVGRLIWLSKAIDEGYNFNIPFLQAYYYQTLSEYEKITL